MQNSTLNYLKLKMADLEQVFFRYLQLLISQFQLPTIPTNPTFSRILPQI